MLRNQRSEPCWNYGRTRLTKSATSMSYARRLDPPLGRIARSKGHAQEPTTEGQNVAQATGETEQAGDGGRSRTTRRGERLRIGRADRAQSRWNAAVPLCGYRSRRGVR